MIYKHFAIVNSCVLAMKLISEKTKTLNNKIKFTNL